jgi:hypothetical protein
LLRLIREVAGVDEALIDLGGGYSILFDALLATGHTSRSMLDVSPRALESLLGGAFRLDALVPEVHTTPAGRSPSFLYCRFRRVS